MFVLSKLLSAITQPLTWLALWWGVALWLLYRRKSTRTRLAVGMLWAGLCGLGLLGFRAIPDALLRPLENRYPIPSAASIDQHVGVIVLGGGIGPPESFLAHGQVPLGDAAERMSVSVQLLRDHPQLQLVFSGGEGRLLRTGVTEAQMAERFYQMQGLDPHHLLFEAASRNTQEDAEQVAKLLGSRCASPWLLVTSAWHMPRAMAEFEAVGCRVTAYPVDFRTGESTGLQAYSQVQSLQRWQLALHEWLGLFVYSMTR